MAEDYKPQPITTANITAGNRAPEDRKDERKVSVKALGRISKDGNPHGELVNVGDTFETHQSRAAELRANGLVEYTNESDGKDIHGNDTERLNARAKERAEQGKIHSKDKSTPLRNPAVKLGDVDDDK